MVSKETYYSVERDILQKRPAPHKMASPGDSASVALRAALDSRCATREECSHSRVTRVHKSARALAHRAFLSPSLSFRSPPLLPHQQAFCSNHTLQRYLAARKGDSQKALVPIVHFSLHTYAFSCIHARVCRNASEVRVHAPRGARARMFSIVLVACAERHANPKLSESFPSFSWTYVCARESTPLTKR